MKAYLSGEFSIVFANSKSEITLAVETGASLETLIDILFAGNNWKINKEQKGRGCACTNLLSIPLENALLHQLSICILFLFVFEHLF